MTYPDWSSFPIPYPPEWIHTAKPISPEKSGSKPPNSTSNPAGASSSTRAASSSVDEDVKKKNEKKGERGAAFGKNKSKGMNYYNMRIGARNEENKLQLEDAEERDKVDKFKLGDYGGKLSCVDHHGWTHDAPIYWNDCPSGGGGMTEMENELNEEYRKRRYPPY